MKNEEKKKVSKEAKEPKENGAELTEEQLSKVSGGDVTRVDIVGYPSNRHG